MWNEVGPSHQDLVLEVCGIGELLGDLSCPVLISLLAPAVWDE